jgi:hypothetical protein
MQTRRDHVEAYRFAANRLATALAEGSPGHGQAPFRQATLGTLAGLVIAALLCGGFVSYGLIDRAPVSSHHQGTIVLDVARQPVNQP